MGIRKCLSESSRYRYFAPLVSMCGSPFARNGTQVARCPGAASTGAIRSTLRTFTFDSEGSVGTPKSSHCPERGA